MEYSEPELDRLPVCDQYLSNTYIPVFVHYAVLVHRGNVVMVKGRILHWQKASALTL